MFVLGRNLLSGRGIVQQRGRSQSSLLFAQRGKSQKYFACMGATVLLESGRFQEGRGKSSKEEGRRVASVVSAAGLDCVRRKKSTISLQGGGGESLTELRKRGVSGS